MARRSSRRLAVAVLATLTCAGTLSVSAVDAQMLPAVDIGDAGLPAQIAPSLVRTRTEVLQAGVVGVLKNGDSESGVDTPVQAFAELNGVIYVGGKFANVQRGAGAPLQAQSYLAAFDRSTGAWIDTFRPTLDGTVWDLAVAGGRLIVAGQFTNVNGVSRTAGLAALDPVTGAVVPGWRASLGLTGTSQRAYARGLDVEGSWVYVGGNFSRITGADGVTTSAGRLARVAVADGKLSSTFRSNVGGTITDLDATPTRVWLAGKFETINGSTRRMAGAVDATTGALVPMQPLVLTYWHPDYVYQQGILQIGDEVWVTGSQHSTQVYRASDFTLLRQWVSDPWGDGQALAHLDGYVYGGSHANSGTSMYSDARSWPELTGWTRRDPVKWIGAWNVAQRDFVGTWQPSTSTSNGEGAWELFVDSTRCLWAGGDFSRGSYVNGVAQYGQGFVKFCTPDPNPPTVPRSPVASVAVAPAAGVSLTWSASTDDKAGALTYEVLRNDSVVASGLTATAWNDAAGRSTDRYFIRAVDAVGNRSATTTVVRVSPAAADTTPPRTPTGVVATLQANGNVTLVWNPSRDNVGVAGYIVFRNGVERLRVPTNSAVVTGLGRGTHYLQVQAFDAAGNLSKRTASVVVVIP